MINVNAMVNFLAIIDQGSFSAAAEVLGQTPSGVSRSLSRLEEQLNVRLLNRTTRRLDLTEEGRWLEQRARSILLELENTQQELTNSFSHPSGLLRVNASTPVFTRLITPIIPEFIKRYPDIRFEFISNEDVIDLIEQQADVAIRVGELADSTLNARRLAKSRMQIVAAPDYLHKNGIPDTPEKLKDHRTIGFKQPVSLNLWPLLFKGKEGYPVDPSIACSSGEVLRTLALSGAGIASLSDFFILDDIETGTLLPVLEEHHCGWHKDIWAVFYKKNILPARTQVFVDFLADKLTLLNS